MTRACIEDQLAAQPAIGLFGPNGWRAVSAMVETFGSGGTFSRETRGEVVLVDRLRPTISAGQRAGFSVPRAWR
jgi:hypothetical protein